AARVFIAGAAQYRSYPRLDLTDAERLDDIIVGASIESANDVSLVVARSRDHDRNFADCPQHPQDLVAVEIGQAEVEDDQVRRTVEDEPKRLHGVRRA